MVLLGDSSAYKGMKKALYYVFSEMVQELLCLQKEDVKARHSTLWAHWSILSIPRGISGKFYRIHFREHEPLLLLPFYKVLWLQIYCLSLFLFQQQPGYVVLRHSVFSRFRDFLSARLKMADLNAKIVL